MRRLLAATFLFTLLGSAPPPAYAQRSPLSVAEVGDWNRPRFLLGGSIGLGASVGSDFKNGAPDPFRFGFRGTAGMTTGRAPFYLGGDLTVSLGTKLDDAAGDVRTHSIQMLGYLGIHLDVVERLHLIPMGGIGFDVLRRTGPDAATDTAFAFGGQMVGLIQVRKHFALTTAMGFSYANHEGEKLVGLHGAMGLAIVF